ncbi:MAG: PIN domain-containing protein, partial [Vicinamibacterales bacterium]
SDGRPRTSDSRRLPETTGEEAMPKYGELIDVRWLSPTARLSAVLSKQGFTSTHAWNRLAELLDLLPLVLPSEGMLVRAKELHLTRGASFWDALILAACAEAGVEIFYSEDVPGFDDFDGVRVVNPFK